VIYSQRDLAGVITNMALYNGNFAGNSFGYYLTTPSGQTWYSDSMLNTDGQADHMVAFQGNGEQFQLPGNAAGPFLTTDYLLGWEDTDSSSWDWDYQDMVLMTSEITPVPEPATMLLFGTGLIGLAGLGRKKFFKK
jgi:hypothetical protein